MDDARDENGSQHGGYRPGAGRKAGSITRNKKDSYAFSNIAERLQIAPEHEHASPLFILLQIMRHYFSVGDFAAAASCADKAAKYYYAKAGAVEDVEGMSDHQLRAIAGGLKKAA